jgi:DNA-binding IclR family transcriptional regulator
MLGSFVLLLTKTIVMPRKTRSHRTKPVAALSAGAKVPDVAPRAKGAVKSAGRVLQVFEFFDEIQRDARVAEIAERLAFPQSSASILLKCLVDLGYMDYLPETRSFLPSPRVTLIGAWLHKGPVRDGSLIRMVEEISQRTGDTVIIAARHGIYSQYIYVMQARGATRFHVPPGSRRLVASSATGFALLVASTESAVRALCTRTNAEAPEGQARVDFNQSWAGIQLVREKGYFFSKGLVTPGGGSIALPLPNGVDVHERPLAVAVSGLLDDFIRREGAIVELMNDVIHRYLSK